MVIVLNLIYFLTFVQRVTQITSGGVRHAVVTSYVRGDFLEISKPSSSQTPPCQMARLGASGSDVARLKSSFPEEQQDYSSNEVKNGSLENEESINCWTRLANSLLNPYPDPVAQATARLLSTLASFTVGRNYLTK